jgi:hypothetical protein
MKIGYKNYPILEKLKNGSLGNMPLFEKDVLFFNLYGDQFVKNWKFYRKGFEHEINIISNPFFEASIKSEKQLLELYGDIVGNDTSDFDVKGCYLIDKFVYMIDYEVRKGNENHEIAFYMFDKKGIPLAMFVDSAKHEIYQNGWVSSCFSVNNNPLEIRNFIYYHIGQIVIFRMFKTYAEVETKIILPNSKQKTIHCKYFNDTSFKLNFLDSKWFTNLVKSDGFTVRGHFRLQPKKKDGKWTKELIWISEFEKTGYSAPARILSNK